MRLAGHLVGWIKMPAFSCNSQSFAVPDPGYFRSGGVHSLNITDCICKNQGSQIKQNF